MNPCDWDVLPPSTPSGTLRATDESPGECHPQEHPNEFDKDAFCGTTSPGVEFGRVSSASNSHGAGPSNQRAETRSTSSIVNFRALHGQRYNGELLRPQLHRETPGNGTQQSLLEGGPRGLGRMAFSFGGRTGGFPPNPEGNHNNNINNTGEGFHPYQHAENARDAVNPLIHKFYHLPPLRNLKMAHPEKVELPPIMGVLGDILQSGSRPIDIREAHNNQGTNPHGIEAGYQQPEGPNLIGDHRFAYANNLAAGRYPTEMEMKRFRNRGHSNGYESFGDYMSLDMPSADLGHFSIMNQHRSRTQPEPDLYIPGEAESDFNIFQEMLKFPDLVLTLASHLRVQELEILYSFCKPFHQIVKKSLTSVMVMQARVRAPEGRQLFPWRCYSSLCIDDPNGRLHDIPEEAAKGVIRKVPTLRWLKMLCFREMVVHEIMTIMEEDGVGLPDQCETAIKKIWFLMDVPDNRRRNALVQSRDIVTDEDLFYMMFFFIKLDIRFTDPVNGGGQDGVRRMLLAQPTLSTLWRTLKRTALVNKLDVIEMFVRWKGELPAEQAQSGQPVLGIPPNDVGMTQYEYWGLRGKGEKLEQLEELLMLESIRRELNLDQYYPDMFLWGYVNPSTRENLPPVVRKRRLERLEGLEEHLITQADREKGDVPKRRSRRVIVLE